ncbi:MAG: L-histidine N(alpha)-methyltransferase [Alphaproteobacteria bacterium]
MDQVSPRFTHTRLADPAQASDDGDAVITGLTQPQKTVPVQYFYDDRGSQLFEMICGLPEYYPTRTERLILETNAADIASFTGPCELVELGSGSASKTRLLLAAHAECDHPLHFLPIDVSEALLTESSIDLLALYDDLRIQAFSGTYERALAALPPRKAPARMVMILGSTIGNFDAQERTRLLDHVTAAMAPGDYFLVGFDLQKDVAIIEAAYNDAQGVTAEFNLNMLRHLNRRYGGNFVLENFSHLAFYDTRAHQIEMHLISRCAHTVTLRELDLEIAFDARETIHTEVSRKFDSKNLPAEFAAAGLEVAQIWTDPKDWFALVLFRAPPVAGG